MLLLWWFGDRNARPIEISPGFHARAEPEERPEGKCDEGAGEFLCGLEELVPQQAQDHQRIGAGRKRGTFGGSGCAGEQFGKGGKLGFYGGVDKSDVLPGRSRVHAAQCLTGRVHKSEIAVPPSFQELHEFLAPEGTARDEMLRQYPFGIWPPCSLRGSTDDRSNTAATPLAVASDRPAQRVGMELKFMAISAKRAAETGDGYLYVGDEVLKCLDLNGYATLFGFVGVGVRKPGKACGRSRSFPAAPYSGHRWGKLPWRKMLRYSGKLGKKAEKVTGEEQRWRSSRTKLNTPREAIIALHGKTFLALFLLWGVLVI